MADPRRPVHLGVAVGLSTCVYAVSLAMVTGFQSGRDAAVTADLGPASDLAAQEEAAHSDLERQLDELRATYNASAISYGSVAERLAHLEQRLNHLAKTVSVLTGAAFALPGLGSVPSVSRAAAASRPAAHTGDAF